jgi:hypothetical protein
MQRASPQLPLLSYCSLSYHAIEPCASEEEKKAGGGEAAGAGEVDADHASLAASLVVA